MKCYVIGIGGSGHRCMESIAHLAAAGIFKCEELTVMFVDSDSGNGNYDRTKRTLEECINISSFIGNSDSFFKTRIKPVISLEMSLWSPLEGTDRSMNLADDQKNLRNILQYNLMSDEEKVLFNYLYTEREINEPLVEGFYGHPSIGSALIAKNLDFSSDPWRTLVHNIKNDVKNDEARVFLISSIFGGTGASGFPTISRYLSNTINSSRLKLGGLLLLPYFRFDASKTAEFGDKLCPDCGNFMAKSKAALFYYDNQRYYDFFDKIYILGDSYDEFVEMEFSRGMSEQKNKPHIVELYSALAAADFLDTTTNGSDQKIALVSRGKDIEGRSASNEGGGAYRYEWEKLRNITNENDEVKNKLAQMLRFAIVYTKTYFPVIESIATSPSNSSPKKSAPWYMHYFVDNKLDIKGTKDDIYTRKLKPLFDYCCKYIDWIYDLHLKDSSGPEQLGDPRVCLFNTSDRRLYNKIYDTKVDLDNFQNLVYDNQKNDNKAQEIHVNMCKKNKKSNHRQRPFVDGFILDLYDCSELK